MNRRLDGDDATAKSGEQLARRIEDEIVKAGWPVGQRLGSEPELMERYGVSRSVLREAIRLLEHHQVGRTREGRGGGLVVSAPESKAVTRALELYLQYRNVTLVDLLATKRAIELAAVPIVAERLDEEAVERLRAAGVAEHAVGEAVFEITDANLHILLAELTGNPAMRVFVEVLTRLSVQMVERDRAMSKAEHTFEDHHAIAEAVIAGDVDRASRLLTSHLDDIEANGALLDQMRVAKQAPGSPSAKKQPASADTVPTAP